VNPVALPASAASAVASAPVAGFAFTADAAMNGAATLVGAFLGAMLAFVFQILFQRSQDRRTERLSAHRILFCLLQQTNTLVLLQRDWIAPRAKSPVSFIEIPAVQDFDLTKNLFDFSSFGFLLKSSEGRQIMYDLYMAQESYVETVRTVNERSRFHRQELQPRMAAAGLAAGKPVTLAELQRILGPLVHGTMVNTTEQMLSLMQSTFEKLTMVKQAFRSHAVSFFRSDDFTDFSFPESYGLAKEQT
jgi:hypothetical protein